MSHIYQPLMVRSLLEKGGTATDKQIAQEILRFDPSQEEYYQKIVNNMVGKVLRNHKVVTKEGKEYFLSGFIKFSNGQIKELINICNQKLTDFLKNRGENIWEHRRKSRGYISGSVRYEVLKRAQFRCEHCGISATERALEVDHIEPKNTGGEDSINNYQALCYKCNSEKRDRDNTDFRPNKKRYDLRIKDCLFCDIEKERIVMKNNLAYLIFDNFPVTNHHFLVIPKRHFSGFVDIGQAELNAVNDLLKKGKEHIQKIDPTIDGYNIGINSGKTAGQTIMHCHIHLIPRREGDVENPRGGVRHLIQGKGYY